VTTADASPGHSVRLALLEHAVLRVSFWPIETLDPFAASGLLEASRQLSVEEARAAERRQAVIDAIHAIVPRVLDRRVRAWLLATKRHVYGSSDPWADPTPDVAAVLAGEPELARRLDEEQSARRALAERRAAFDRLHAETLERQRAALRDVAATPAFRRALALTAPVVYERWRRVDGRPDPSTARGRRLETTVFHYVARAAVRPTPHGAWAGVAPVSPGDSSAAGGLRVHHAPRRYAATVNLTPFSVMARALAVLPRYGVGYPLRLNPTLFEDSRGWRFEAFDRETGSWRHLAANPLDALILRYYADGEPRPVTPLLDAAAPDQGLLRERLTERVAELLAAGALLPNLSLGAGEDDPWRVLERLVPRLLEPERTTWRGAIGRIRQACDRLAAEFDGLDPETVVLLQRAVEDEMARLWADCGLPGRPPGPPLYLDARAPVAVTWTPAFRQAAARAVETRFRFYAADGGAELYRRCSLDPIVRAAPAGRPVSLLSLLAALSDREPGDMTGEPAAPGHVVAGPGDSREQIFVRFALDPAFHRILEAQAQAWETRLAPVHEARTAWLDFTPDGSALRPGPGGAMLLPVTGDGHVWTGVGRPQPGLFASRVALLLREDGDTESGLLAALRDQGTRAAARAGGQLVEVVGSDPVSLNAAVRPALGAATLEPHGPRDASLAGVDVVADPDRARLWLTRGAAREPLFPVYNSGAAVGWQDACSALLLMLAFGHGWEYASFGFPALPAERTRWHHLPRLVARDGTVLSPERWTLDAPTIAKLAALRGPARYRAWQAEVERRALPPLVLVRDGSSESELPLRTDSPLALRCLFDTVARRAPYLVMTELPGDPVTWPIRDAVGQHYRAELAVTWLDEEYWTAATTPPGRVPEREASHGRGPTT
jgi:hypothetical protein